MSKKASVAHRDIVMVYVNESLRKALEELTVQRECVTLQTYIREVLESHVADIRGAKREERPVYLYTQGTIEEVEL